MVETIYSILKILFSLIRKDKPITNTIHCIWYCIQYVYLLYSQTKILSCPCHISVQTFLKLNSSHLKNNQLFLVYIQNTAEKISQPVEDSLHILPGEDGYGHDVAEDADDGDPEEEESLHDVLEHPLVLLHAGTVIVQ